MTAPAPQRQRLLAILAVQLIGDRLKRTVQDGAIVICQRVESSFDDEAAQLDQMMRAFAAVHDPCSPCHIAPGSLRSGAGLLLLA